MLIGVLAFLLIGIIFEGRLHLPAVALSERWRLPGSGLQIVEVSPTVIAGLRRMGNARRAASALSDEDVGLRLSTQLPEPESAAREVLSSLHAKPSLQSHHECNMMGLLPAMEPTETKSLQGTRVMMDMALKSAGFRLEKGSQTPMVSSTSSGWATFLVVLNEDGGIDSLLRMEPRGRETPWLRSVRKMLATGCGRKAALGFVKVTWSKEGSL